jgi:hypothetical protein
MFDDERIQFYLKHHSEIREWAAIERDVFAATRELLGRVQMQVDERLAEEVDALTARLDDNRFERILVRHEHWPNGVGVALEWENSVDPFGSSLPKYGIFVLGVPSEMETVRAMIVKAAKESPLQASFKIPADRVWPALSRVPKSADWWRDPDAWTGGIADNVVELWRVAAPIIDQALVPGAAGMD